MISFSAFSAFSAVNFADFAQEDYGGLALVFAELTGCRPQWKQALEVWNMLQSVQVLEWQAETFKNGEAKGKAEGKADSILRILKRRFSVPPTELVASIRSATDLVLLDQWIDIAATAASLDEFRHDASL